MALHMNKGTSVPTTPEPQDPLDNLSETAKTVSAATRKLSEAVEQLNEALKKLNLGVAAWVVTCHGPDIPGMVEETEEVGYARVKGKWGVCLRRTIEHAGPDPDVTEWHFSEAPRDIRQRAAGSLSKIVPALQKEAAKTASELDAHADDALKLAQNILAAATKSKTPVSLNPATFQREVK
ncbi:hypothetical protein [Granulicella paludicola]|uniref:hypothetical protein n=1 Tax=Granulicella paludicola TaxID=474951 RepID=UPI0021E0A078|nr:hypothetical protein [Granulicella paludicola]